MKVIMRVQLVMKYEQGERILHGERGGAVTLIETVVSFGFTEIIEKS